jgi:hypothetical protein
MLLAFSPIFHRCRSYVDISPTLLELPYKLCAKPQLKFVWRGEEHTEICVNCFLQIKCETGFDLNFLDIFQILNLKTLKRLSGETNQL